MVGISVPKQSVMMSLALDRKTIPATELPITAPHISQNCGVCIAVTWLTLAPAGTMMPLPGLGEAAAPASSFFLESFVSAATGGCQVSEGTLFKYAPTAMAVRYVAPSTAKAEAAPVSPVPTT